MIVVLWVTVYPEWFFGGAISMLLYDNYKTLRQAYRERKEEASWVAEYWVIDKKSEDDSVERAIEDIKRKLLG